jgi:hypothetical protein
MACSIAREAGAGRPAEISCMDVIEGKAPAAQEITQGAPCASPAGAHAQGPDRARQTATGSAAFPDALRPRTLSCLRFRHALAGRGGPGVARRGRHG